MIISSGGNKNTQVVPSFPIGRINNIDERVKTLEQSGGAGITLKTNGVSNGSQGILDLKNGTNVTITDDGVGGVTISASGGGGSGDVTGPASSTDSGVVLFNGLTGKIIKDSGVTLSSKEDSSNKDTDGTLSANSDTKYASQKATKTYVDTGLGNKVTSNGAITGATKTKITYDAKGLVTSGADATTADIADSANKRYVTDAQLTVISNTSGTNTGDQTISDATLTTSDITTNNFSTLKHGFVPKGTNVGNFLKDDGTWAAPGGSGDMVLASTQTNSGLKTFLNSTLGLRNVANTFTSFFTNTNTASRTYTLKDADGTLAFTSDITGTNSGTNTGDVTLSGTPNYITIAGQVITRALIDLANHVTGKLPFANIADVSTSTVMYRKTAGTGSMESQTLATLKTDLGLTGTNSGDQTSIVGITGTKAQFNTAVTDGDILYVGDVTSNATHTGDVTGATTLTIDPTAITGKTQVTAVGSDYILISDTSDSGNLKKALASDLAGSAAAGGSTTQVQFNDGGSLNGDAGLVFDKTNDTLTVTSNTNGNGLVVQSSKGAGAGTENLVLVQTTDTLWDRPLLRINDSSSAGGAANIRIDSPNPDIEFVETDQVSPAGKFEVAVNADKFLINGRSAADSGFEPIATFTRYGSGGMVGIGTQYDTPNAMVEVVSTGTPSYNFSVSSAVGATSGNIFNVDGSGNVIVNDRGNAVAMRVEGDTDANLLYTDGTNDRVGIGLNNPTQKLHVKGRAQFGVASNTSGTIDLANSAAAGLTRLSPGAPGADVTMTFPTTSGTVALTSDLSSYQPLDTQLTSLAGLSYTGNGSKVVRVNAGETAFELATVSGSGDVTGPSSATGNAITRFDSTTGKLIKNSSVTISDNGEILLAAGGTADAPIKFTSGTNLTTAEAGAVEYDGTLFYSSTNASQRGIMPSILFTHAGADYTLTNGNTAQSVFTAAQDTLTVEASTTYIFDAQYIITNGTTTHTTAVGFGGTATVNSLEYAATLWSAAANTITTTQSTTWVTGLTSKVINATSTAASTIIQLRGTISVNASGTLIPQLTFSAAPGGTNVLKRGSYFKLYRIGASAPTFMGNWG